MAVMVVALNALLGSLLRIMAVPSPGVLPSQARALSDTVPAKWLPGTKRMSSPTESKDPKVAEAAGKLGQAPPPGVNCQTPLASPVTPTIATPTDTAGL